MRGISTAELAVLVNELQEYVGFYIDRFYEVSDSKFRLKLSKNKVQPNIQIILSYTINKTNYIEKQEQASNFTIAVRKRIEGFNIKAIKQLNNDRIVLFELKKGEEQFNLIVEMFGKGNLIITDKEMKIVLVYTQQESKDRIIKSNLQYKTPKQSSDYKIEMPNEISPIIYRKEGKSIDYSITPNERHKELEIQKFATLQEALDVFYYENKVGEQKEENKEQKKMIEELQNSIKKQEKILKGIENEIQVNKEIGKQLLENMNMINEMIKAAQSNKRITRDELQRMFPKIRVLNVDLKDKKATIELNV
ncbi:MAG: NFACT family protein [Candidatus Micrarchaeales archaeon]